MPTARRWSGRARARRSTRCWPPTRAGARQRPPPATGRASAPLVARDGRWRALVPVIDEVRGKTKLKGKPSPEQLAELQQVKEQLRDAEAEYGEAETERDRLPAPGR